MSSKKNCPLCAIIAKEPESIKTFWFYIDDDFAVVEDLNPKGHKLRVLVVSKEHIHVSSASPQLWQKLKSLGLAVAEAQALCRGLRISGCDLKRFSYPDHMHLQYCLDG